MQQIFSTSSLAALVLKQTHACEHAAAAAHNYVHRVTCGGTFSTQLKSTHMALTPPAGLEPAVFGLEVRRLVH